MQKTITGKAFVLGNNIDTDQIIPAEHLVYNISDPEESKNYGKFALSGAPLSQSGLPQANVPFVNEGEYQSEYNIIVGGSNFGCGSSREHAPFALMVAGTKAIVAESYARIFYRNSVDGGFVIPLESKIKLSDKIKTGDKLEIDLETNSLKNITDGKVYEIKSLGEALAIVEAGGLFEYARKASLI